MLSVSASDLDQRRSPIGIIIDCLGNLECLVKLAYSRIRCGQDSQGVFAAYLVFYILGNVESVVRSASRRVRLDYGSHHLTLACILARGICILSCCGGKVERLRVIPYPGV